MAGLDTNLRRRFAKRITPDTHIEAVFVLKAKKGPTPTTAASMLRRYIERYGITNTLGSIQMLGDQYVVLTEHRLLLFGKRGSGFVARIGQLEHALDRTDVTLEWADFVEATLRKRLIHLTTTDHRMNVGITLLTGKDEADQFVRAMGDRAREIGLQELDQP